MQDNNTASCAGKLSRRFSTNIFRTKSIQLGRALFIVTVLNIATTSAHAQSNVTLYGAADSGLLYQSSTAKNAGSVLAQYNGGLGPSFWGILGNEDLGGGYKAVFRLENAYLTTTGAAVNPNSFFNRYAFVGIESPFGTLHLGSEISAFYIAVAKADPKSPSLFASTATALTNAGFAAAGFTDNEVSYTSPTMAGFQWRFDYGFGNVAGNFRAGSAVSTSLNYTNGPFSGVLGYTSSKDNATGAPTLRGETASLGYVLGPVTGRVIFDKFRNMSTSAPLTNINLYGCGLEWQVTPAAAVTTAVYSLHDRNVSANKSMMYRLGTIYSLSLRTSLYAQVALIHNDAGMNTTFAYYAPSSYAPGKGTSVGVNVGIRHNF